MNIIFDFKHLSYIFVIILDNSKFYLSLLKIKIKTYENN